LALFFTTARLGAFQCSGDTVAGAVISRQANSIRLFFRGQKGNLVRCVCVVLGTWRNLGTPGVKEKRQGSSFYSFLAVMVFWACVLGAQKKSFYGE
jgi:hypothetical protein